MKCDRHFITIEKKDLYDTEKRINQLEKRISIIEKWYAIQAIKLITGVTLWHLLIKSKTSFICNYNNSIIRITPEVKLEVIEYIGLLLNKKFLLTKGKNAKLTLKLILNENNKKGIFSNDILEFHANFEN